MPSANQRRSAELSGNAPVPQTSEETFGIFRRSASSAKLNDIAQQAWHADVLARIADTPISNPEQLLAWNWQPHELNAQAA
nr:transposase domain-containing protein [Rhizobium leguminosarum]